MDKDYLVTKSNYFIMNSSYDLSLEEQKIILTLASMVQPDDEEFKPYNFRIAEFMDLLGVEDKSKYSQIPKITKDLMKKVFEIQEGDTLIQTAWLSGTKYKKGTGYVELTFSPYLKPYMLKLNSMFTQYKLANILNMKSKYSPRIYEFLKCNEFKKQGYIEIEVENLRKLLKADNIYPMYNDFKRFVIERTQKELKKLSDISFDFEEVKTGRKVTSIRFYIKSKIKNRNEVAATLLDVPAPSALDQDLDDGLQNVKNLFAEEITSLEAKQLLDAANGNINTIKEKYEVAREYSIHHQIDGIVGFIIRAIKEGWQLPQSKRGRTRWSDYDQRDYNMKELEKQIRANYHEDEEIK